MAAGAGNAAIPAAQAGAQVVASDLTPEMFEVGRAEAANRGVQLDWQEADAEALPFSDGSFDVVMSCMGAMFAPNHQAVADELVRVCRPGGTIGMINATPGGWVDEFFRTLAPYAPPPPPNSSPPIRWGEREHLRALFGEQITTLELTQHRHLVEAFANPTDMCAYYKAYFGPVIAAYAYSASDPDQLAALDREFLAFAERTNLAEPAANAVYPFDYTLVITHSRHP